MSSSYVVRFAGQHFLLSHKIIGVICFMPQYDCIINGYNFSKYISLKLAGGELTSPEEKVYHKTLGREFTKCVLVIIFVHARSHRRKHQLLPVYTCIKRCHLTENWFELHYTRKVFHPPSEGFTLLKLVIESAHRTNDITVKV